MTYVRIPRFDCFTSRLGCCQRGATIAEFGVAAALVVTAWGAVGSPRFQTIKDEPCVSTSRASARHDKAMFNARLDAAPCRVLASRIGTPVLNAR
jgi:hypothetical protein